MDKLFLKIKFSYLLNVCHLLKADHIFCLTEYVNQFSRKHFILNESVDRSFKVNSFSIICLFYTVLAT